jgi:hypothetical protein
VQSWHCDTLSSPHLPPDPSYCKWRLRAGRCCWSMGNAADSAGAAAPSRDYGQDRSADRLSRSTPRQADDTTTRPSGERADASVLCTGLGVSQSKHYIRRGPGQGTFYYCMRRLFLGDNHLCNRLGIKPNQSEQRSLQRQNQQN